MIFVILVPLFLLPAFLIFWYLYQKIFEGNYLMLGLAGLIVLLSILIYFFYRFGYDKKLTMRTSKYAIRYNEQRAESGLPLLTYDFSQEGNTWNAKLDSISDTSKFVLVQKIIEENDTHTDAEQEYNFLAKALSDTTVLYLKIQFNFNTKNYYAETRLGNLSRPSYFINKMRIFDDCCSIPYKKSQVDSLLKNSF